MTHIIEKDGVYICTTKKVLFSGINKTFHANKQLRTKETYQNGLKHGIWKEYHSNSQLQLIGFYVIGNQDGEWREYYSNSQLHLKKLNFAKSKWMLAQ